MHHVGIVTAVAFSPDGKIALTGSGDGTARLWDARTGSPIGSPLRHEDQVEDVVFSPDGQIVLIGGYKGVRLWKVPSALEGMAERTTLWVQTLTGSELDSEGAFHFLDAQTWENRRRRLQELGGPPLP